MQSDVIINMYCYFCFYYIVSCCGDA